MAWELSLPLPSGDRVDALAVTMCAGSDDAETTHLLQQLIDTVHYADNPCSSSHTSTGFGNAVARPSTARAGDTLE